MPSNARIKPSRTIDGGTNLSMIRKSDIATFLGRLILFSPTEKKTEAVREYGRPEVKQIRRLAPFFFTVHGVRDKIIFTCRNAASAIRRGRDTNKRKAVGLLFLRKED